MLLVDTNIWLAAADRRSEHHSDCAQILRAHRAELACTVPVIAETSWLILDRLGPASQSEFLRTLTSRHLEFVNLTETDWHRCVELVDMYTNLRLDLMDASLVAAGERLGVTTIATMNRRDFNVVRPRHIDVSALPLLSARALRPLGDNPERSGGASGFVLWPALRGMTGRANDGLHRGATCVEPAWPPLSGRSGGHLRRWHQGRFAG